MSTNTIILTSPCGELLLVADEQAIIGLYFLHGNPPQLPTSPPADQRATQLLEVARLQLDEYFAGRRQRFDLPLKPPGTSFQQRVWAELQNIPYGVTWTYGEQARRLGSAAAARAVGAANGRNPIAIIIPCHRVIGAKGMLTGYGGGLERKQQLLAFEAGRADAWVREKVPGYRGMGVSAWHRESGRLVNGRGGYP
jgi:methylated-DNA-[protein]-cysteine S-methyltransferase